MTDEKSPEQLLSEKAVMPEIVKAAANLISTANGWRILAHVPTGSTRVYWLLAMVNGDVTEPVAIIPTNNEWLRTIDKLIGEHGSAQSDPEFKGVVQ